MGDIYQWLATVGMLNNGHIFQNLLLWKSLFPRATTYLSAATMELHQHQYHSRNGMALSIWSTRDIYLALLSGWPLDDALC